MVIEDFLLKTTDYEMHWENKESVNMSKLRRNSLYQIPNVLFLHIINAGTYIRKMCIHVLFNQTGGSQVNLKSPDLSLIQK